MMRVTSAILFAFLAIVPGTSGFGVKAPVNVNVHSKHQTNLMGTTVVEATEPYSFGLQQENTHKYSMWGAPTPAPKKNFWGWGKKSTPPPPTPLQAVAVQTVQEPDEVVVLQKDFRLTGMLLGSGFLLDSINVPVIQDVVGPLVTLFGGFILLRTMQLKFVCLEDDFAFYGSGKNAIVGGNNEWGYDSIRNYEFFPKGWEDQPQGPILAYIKEIQTPREKWNTGPGRYANSDKALGNGAVPGMVHFMPAIFNTKQLRDEFERRGIHKL
jgi:hypothetical protein